MIATSSQCSRDPNAPSPRRRGHSDRWFASSRSSLGRPPASPCGTPPSSGSRAPEGALGRLVYAPASQETSDPGHAWIVLDLEGRSLDLVERLEVRLAQFGVPLHGAKHVADEDLFVRPDALLPE